MDVVSILLYTVHLTIMQHLSISFPCKWSKIYLLINRKQVSRVWFEGWGLSAAVFKLLLGQPEHAVSYWLLINVSSMDTVYWSLTCYTVCPWQVEVNCIPLTLFLWDLSQVTTGIYQTSGAEVTTLLALERTKISQMYFCLCDVWPFKLCQEFRTSKWCKMMFIC